VRAVSTAYIVTLGTAGGIVATWYVKPLYCRLQSILILAQDIHTGRRSPLRDRPYHQFGGKYRCTSSLTSWNRVLQMGEPPAKPRETRSSVGWAVGGGSQELGIQASGFPLHHISLCGTCNTSYFYLFLVATFSLTLVSPVKYQVTFCRLFNAVCACSRHPSRSCGRVVCSPTTDDIGTWVFENIYLLHRSQTNKNADL